eukprot:SAG31_NODE_1585_length_7821_cov_5.615903_4_plen_683_part_00
MLQWGASVDNPRLLEADVTAWQRPVTSLRIGESRRERSRFPSRSRHGSPSERYKTGWAFAQSPRSGVTTPEASSCIWCNKTLCGPRIVPPTPYCWLGLDPNAVPKSVLQAMHLKNSSWLNIFGTGEADVLDMMLPVREVNVDGSAVKIQILPYDPKGGFHEYQRLWLENVPVPIPPGEFFFDDQKAIKTVLYNPLNLTERASLLAGALHAVAPVADRLLDINGTSSLTLRGITFRDTAYYAVGTWYGPAAEPSDGAIRINEARDISIEACSFLPGLSGYGIVVGNSSTRVDISGSHFEGLGEGGVLMYGVAPNKDAANLAPFRNSVHHCVFHDLGKTLVHVAAVSLRASHGNVISHNRITMMPRYALEADTFYNTSQSGGRISRDNVFEFNVIDDVCYATTDTGAIEMLGSGDASLVDFQLNNTVRYNKVTNVQGSSSSDGRHVCQGQATNKSLGCRGITWAIYLDGGYSGAHIHGNVLDGSSKGAMIINGGGNIAFENNIVLDAKTSNAELNFCYQLNNTKQDLRVTSWPSSTFARNIWSWTSTRSDSRVFGIPGPPNGPPCIWVPTRVKSDYNLVHNRLLDASTAPLFPGDMTLSKWQSGNTSSLEVPSALLGPPFGFPPRDVHSIVADPMFVGSAYDGVLDPESPAIKKLNFIQLPNIESEAPKLRGSTSPTLLGVERD